MGAELRGQTLHFVLANREAGRTVAGMARKLRIEAEGAVYHVIARGNYRTDVFAAEATKAAFLHCLDEACTKSGWLVHAWCVMSNHYHLCLRTPRANLVEGMRWLQATFSLRFNRFRSEQGHVFQGRYKALPVEPEAVGAVCHYIHLNPVRAHLVGVEALPDYPWTSMQALARKCPRADWLAANEALEHAGGLKDTPAGHQRYLTYLDWLQQNDEAQKQLAFERMSKDWAVGTLAFRKELLREHKHLEGALARKDRSAAETREARWREQLERFLKAVAKAPRNIAADPKGSAWKVAVASAMKSTTTVTNPWLARQLNMGSPFRVSRLASACRHAPGPYQPFATLTAKCKV